MCVFKTLPGNRLGFTEELHVIKFVTTVQFAGLKCDVEASSLPFAVFTFCTPPFSAWASIMWWTMLSPSEPWNLSLFTDPPPLSWELLSQALSWQFLSVGHRGLDENQLATLRDKLEGQHGSCGDYQVSWSKFLKENIPGKPFSFWAWLDFILSLIKEHLTPLWNDNYIMGFVSKETERALLKDREPGTFLLRFSESHLGGITFTWVERGMDGEVKFNSVEPYTSNCLNWRLFANIIRDYKIFSDGVLNDLLKFLYPDIPKDEAFSRFYSTQPQRPEPSEPPITPGEFESLSLDMEIISLI
ncbi:signal transducer and activator of transcription 4-like [Salarias fasciatus]|uniref:signal transducer and activator of transcription 4-like n=1 Tax=Salarias fasciatus TaxID=181472 RepID=UPI001176C72D|nr:signal transducer and activator of transcription 4-like [Salarias fasciatus]